MPEQLIWALSGFLGLKSDWNIFEFQNLIAFDLDEFHWNNLNDWGEKFNRIYACDSQIKPILMGYSLGGRLALHALIADPSRWEAAIIISANPGLEKSEDRAQRILQDEKWARRFEKEEWQTLLSDWNNQSVFSCEEPYFKRNEEDYHRHSLMHALRACSLGLQANLRDKISELDLPILWINGEKDVKFCKAAESINLRHPLSKKVMIPQAGHRVPWEHPLIFREIIQDFMLIKCIGSR